LQRPRAIRLPLDTFSQTDHVSTKGHGPWPSTSGLGHTEGLTPSYGGKFRNEQFSGGRCPASKLAEKPSTASLAITSAVHGPELIALREALLRARQGTGDALKDLDFPAIPSRGQILVEAMKRFVCSVSLEEIGAYALFSS
jgi:hypothetical protein